MWEWWRRSVTHNNGPRGSNAWTKVLCVQDMPYGFTSCLHLGLALSASRLLRVLERHQGELRSWQPWIQFRFPEIDDIASYFTWPRKTQTRPPTSFVNRWDCYQLCFHKRVSLHLLWSSFLQVSTILPTCQRKGTQSARVKWEKWECSNCKVAFAPSLLWF